MPNLPMHIYLCQQVAEELDWGYAHDHAGAAYLGSTTPDIRAMTKWDRARTHFSDLSVNHVGAGVQRMFELHPHLAGSNNGLVQAGNPGVPPGLRQPYGRRRNVDYDHVPPPFRSGQSRNRYRS